MAAAIGWSALAASSLVVGGLLGTARRWPDRGVGVVLSFGAGALISAVSFDLAEEGVRIGGAGWLALGLGLGAITYFVLDRRLERQGSGGTGLALGALLDGVPEQMVLGIVIASGEGVSVSLLLAIFVSNLPEAIGASSDLEAAGHAPGRVRRLWLLIATACTAAGIAGYALADVASNEGQAAINGFAAGALLVMLVDSMIPEAREDAGPTAGLVTVLGFAVAAGLSALG